MMRVFFFLCFFFFQAEDGIRDGTVTGVQTCALPICWFFPARGSTREKPARPEQSRPENGRQDCLREPPPGADCGAGRRPSERHRRRRSEERRVGKECRSRWSPGHQKKKE